MSLVPRLRFSPSRLLTVVLAVTIAVAGLAVPAAAVPTGPAGDAFYVPPDPLPHGEPGALIRAQPITAPTGAQAWRVLYHSRAVDGRDIAVSGVIVAPVGAAPKGGRPVVAWAHGTTGIADTCTPSHAPDAAVKIPFVADLLTRGAVVTATDYEGLGTPGRHPYLVGASEGRGVLDSLRAARNLRATDASKQVVVYGHSQGGHASLFAGELAASYAPELRLRGVEAGAPAADAATIASAAANLPRAAGFALLEFAGFHAAYPKAALEAVLTPDAIAKSAIVDQACIREVIGAYAAGPVPITSTDPLAVKPWGKILRQSSAGGHDPGAPLLVVQGDADQVVPKALTDSFVQKACARGDTLEYRVYPGADHAGSLFAGKTDILAWLDARLAGEPAPSTC
jgi:alpha-beta hydrolase superfamily lysophospholipase